MVTTIPHGQNNFKIYKKNRSFSILTFEGLPTHFKNTQFRNVTHCILKSLVLYLEEEEEEEEEEERKSMPL